jgi:predicted short-subunit dehydrogenase-like oxidoreductase (DUF2520 family)
MKRTTVAIVGPGRLGTALAKQLASAGCQITEIISRSGRHSLATATKLARKLGARARTSSDALLDATVIWFCVPDSEISKAAAEFARRNWKGKVALHSSGVLTSDALGFLRKKGAAVASVHPLMTFVEETVPELTGVPFAIEGEPRAVNFAKIIVRDLGGDAFPIRKKDKAAYHAFATMICPLLVSLLATSESVAAMVGISHKEARRRMMPIIHQTLINYSKLGPAGAFSGPLVRGDAETVRKHLKVLAKNRVATNVYIALAEAALEYLPSRNARELGELLRGVTPGRTPRSAGRTNPGSKRSTGRS